MVDTCDVSFTARDTSFTLLPGQVVVFRPTGPQLDSAGSVLRVRKAVSVTANGAGAATAALIPGPYLLEAQVDGKLTAVPCTVPDQATATIDDCIAAVTADAYGALAVAALAVGLRFYGNSTAAELDSTLPIGSGFLAPHIPSGVTMGVYRKVSMGGMPPVVASVYAGPLFPAAQFLPGTLGAPGLAVQGDSDTGIYSPAANQLAGVAGGVLGWLLSTSGLTINGLVSGTAVAQGVLDSTIGRLLRVGDHGIGVLGSVNYLADVDAGSIPQGLWQTDGASPGTLGTFPAGQNRFGHLLNLRVGNNEVWQVFKSIVGRRIFSRSRTSGVWSGWEEIFHAGSLLGTVSQSGGVPTGRVIERGTNANGEFVRFADGTQICTRTNLSVANANTAVGALFRSADVPWTFPASFAAAPAMAPGDVDDADAWLTVSGAPSTTSVNLRVLSAVTKGSALNTRPMAVGRWF